MKKQIVKIDKLVFGGQGLAQLANGKKVFVWGALPTEIVRIRIIKNKKDYSEAIVEEVMQPSLDRSEPLEENYLSTSPWQIMTFLAENKYKTKILKEVFKRENIELPKFTFIHNNQKFGYRNKMEYSFWGDDNGVQLALHRRGSRGKDIVKGSKLAIPALDIAANNILDELNRQKIRASDLKTMIIRVSQSGDAVASIFVKKETFNKLLLPSGIKGLAVHYSNPKSPASIITKTLYVLGDTVLKDKLLGVNIEYNSDSFFQVNIPMFNSALQFIKQFIVDDSVVDMYGGVGSIGLSVAKSSTIIELDKETFSMAKVNVAKKGFMARAINSSAEQALEYIATDKTLIVDPPRAGLHKNAITRILNITPKQIIYLSCNPATQSRDVALLSTKYNIKRFEAYNFFPRTPHIESLVILQRKNLL